MLQRVCYAVAAPFCCFAFGCEVALLLLFDKQWADRVLRQ